MTLDIHFISGLPRSGSTLLGSLLRQNPKFCAGMSSPLSYIYTALQNALGGRNDYSYFIDDAARRRVLRGLFENYYADQPPESTIFCTNRLWTARIFALPELFPDCKFICCVRPLAWVFDSFENLLRKNAFEPSSMFGFESGGHYLSRLEALNHHAAQVGAPYNSLKEAFYGEHTDRLLLVRYDSLVARPQQVLDEIYDFIEETPFVHTFTDVAFEADEYDRRVGMPGLHHVRSVVQSATREPILPPDVYARFQGSSFWEPPAPNPRGVRVI